MAVGEVGGEPVVITPQRGAATWTPYGVVRLTGVPTASSYLRNVRRRLRINTKRLSKTLVQSLGIPPPSHCCLVSR
jgi:hypothetical protein